MRVLVACEESQTVCKAFRELGHEAYSCDIQDCSGGHPEWHVTGDCVPLLDGRCSFTTSDGARHSIDSEWDLLICHPPCTYMSKAGARWMYAGGVLNQERLALAMKARDFFLRCLNARCKHVAVENPVPLKIVELPPPTCHVEPYQHGEPFSKRTCLWLRNLPPITPTNILQEYRPYLPSNVGGKKKGQKYSFGVARNAKEASKTFEGIAKAMAEQWSAYLAQAQRCLTPLRHDT